MNTESYTRFTGKMSAKAKLVAKINVSSNVNNE